MSLNDTNDALVLSLLPSANPSNEVLTTEVIDLSHVPKAELEYNFRRIESNSSAHQHRSLTRLDTDYSNDPFQSDNLSPIEDSDVCHRTVDQVFSQTDPDVENFNAEQETNFKESRNYGQNRKESTTAKLLHTLGALGVVFGDLGAPPIYVVSSIYVGDDENATWPTDSDVIGGISNIIWLLVVVVCIKHCVFILSADFHGEGGAFAMFEMIMANSVKLSKVGIIILPILACLAEALLFGDAAIVPAISIMAALEGITVIEPDFEHYIIPVALVIVAFLYFIQKWGTAKLGVMFGPILLVWFLTMAILGIYSMNKYGTDILEALNPYSAIKWWIYGDYSGYKAFTALSQVMICLTGAELMYADLGHFGRKSICRAWFFIVFPCLVLQYLGQGAFLIKVGDGESELILSGSLIDKLRKFSVFWLIIGDIVGHRYMWFAYYMISISTLATLVASQSVISGVFSMMNQASLLGFFPKLNVVYTNAKQKGQVYIGSVCIAQGILCALMILIFRSHAKLEHAFGAAVTSVFLITTIILCFYVAPINWNCNPISWISLFIVFGSLDMLMWASSMQKVPDGAWMPLVIGIFIMSMMLIWCKIGEWRAASWDEATAASLSQSLITVTKYPYSERLKLTMAPSITRCDGVAIFLSSSGHYVPLALSRLCTRFHSAPRFLLFVYVQISPNPFVAKWERLEFLELQNDESGCAYFVTISFGWAEPLASLNIIEFLRLGALDGENNEKVPLPILDRFGSVVYENDGARVKFAEFEQETLSIFTERHIGKVLKQRSSLVRILHWIYDVLKYLVSPNCVEYFHLPADNTTEIGIQL